MTRGTRTLVALGAAFVAYRVLIEFMSLASALVVGLVVGGIVWAVTGSLVRGRPRSADDEPAGAEPARAPRPRWLLPVVVGVVALGLVTSGVVAFAQIRSPAPASAVATPTPTRLPQYTVRGTVAFKEISGMLGNDELSCWGMGPYRDVHADSQLNVSGRSGFTLATAELPPGRVEGAEPDRICRFTFVVEVVEGEGAYYFQVGELPRAKIMVSEHDLADLQVDIALN